MDGSDWFPRQNTGFLAGASGWYCGRAALVLEREGRGSIWMVESSGFRFKTPVSSLALRVGIKAAIFQHHVGFAHKKGAGRNQFRPAPERFCVD